MPTTHRTPAAEPGSFRDRTARVFYQDGGVYRGLDSAALCQWEALRATSFFARLVAEGRLVATRQVEAAGGWAAVLEHEALPYISYPYEWCFGMLRDAALLHLGVLREALAEGMTLKDGSAYNVQWRGVRPTFIDVPSLVRLGPGQPWSGYRQFCQLFLFPLILQAYRGVPFQPWLRGRLEGITAAEARAILSWRDLFRPGVFGHVFLQALLQSGSAGGAAQARRRLRAAGFDRRLIEANVAGLQKLVGQLCWRPASPWSAYDRTSHYSPGEREHKERFVREALATRPWGLVWDLGCNTGRFARLAAEHARCVVAFDADAASVERFYQQLRGEGQERILPLVVNLADSSPGLGWRGRERRSLAGRGRPDLTLCLALLHHLVLADHLPLPGVIGWLARLTGHLVIEFATPADPMVQALLSARDGPAGDYDLAVFESCLRRHFEVLRREALASGTRLLYFARRRP